METRILEQLYEGASLRSSALREKPTDFVGVDLGQARDYTAIVIVERARWLVRERDPITGSFRSGTFWQVRHAERVPLGASYPDVVEHIRRLVKREPIAGRCTLVVDATGVGAPVVDLLRRERLGCPVVPVVITAGETASSDGVRYRVPKRDLIAGLQVAFQKRRLGLAQGLPMLGELREELRSMRVRVSENGSERYAGRVHDDLVLALALAWWKAGSGGG